MTYSVEGLHHTATTMLDSMIEKYQADKKQWAEKGRPATPKDVDADMIATAMLPLVEERPGLTAWLLSCSLMRLGDEPVKRKRWWQL